MGSSRTRVPVRVKTALAEEGRIRAWSGPSGYFRVVVSITNRYRTSEESTRS